MKKILLSTLLLVSLGAFASPYEDFSKQNKSVEKFEKVLNFELNKPLDNKKIQDLGMYIEKNDDAKKIKFYKARKLKNEIFGIPLSDITFLVQDEKLMSAILEYPGEPTFKKLLSLMTQKYGKPLSYQQNNEQFTYIWGVSTKEKTVRPLVLNFDIYQQMGVIIWSAPQLDFDNK